MTTATTTPTDPTVEQVRAEHENWRSQFVEGECYFCGEVGHIHRFQRLAKPRCNKCVMKLLYPGGMR